MSRIRSLSATVAGLAFVASMATSAVVAAEPMASGGPMASGEPMAATGIEHRLWLLESQSVDGTETAVPDGVHVSLVMEAGQSGGTGGCNAYFASYALDGDSISFDGIGSTMMFCAGPEGDVENVYLANLAMVASWTSDDTSLVFADADGADVLSFAPAPDASILGAWVASSVNNGTGGVVSSDTTGQITAVFDAEGRLTGNDGCNSYFTSYKVDGDSITIDDAIGSTMMACPSDDLAQQAQEYYAALVAATTWSVDVQGNLELRDDGDALQVSYAPDAS